MKLLSTLNKKFDFELIIDPLLEYDDFTIGVMREFIRLVISELEIKAFFKVAIVSEKKKHGIVTSAFYRRSDKLIMIYGNGRILGDILRSIAHELVHHWQYEHERVPDHVQDVGGCIENEANALAGVFVKLFIKDHPYGKYLFP